MPESNRIRIIFVNATSPVTQVVSLDLFKQFMRAVESEPVSLALKLNSNTLPAGTYIVFSNDTSLMTHFWNFALSKSEVILEAVEIGDAGIRLYETKSAPRKSLSSECMDDETRVVESGESTLGQLLGIETES